MRERWMALELGQRQLVAGLVAAIVAVGLVTGAVALLGGGGGGTHEHLQTASGPSTTTTTAADGSTSSTASAAGSSSTTAHGSSTTSTTTKGTAKSTSGGGSSTSTTATGKGKGGGGATTSTSGATTTTAPRMSSCGSGGSGATQIDHLYCQYRADKGLAAMTRNSALDGVAQQWAQKLANDGAAAIAAGQTPPLSHNIPGNNPTYPGGYSAAVTADCGPCGPRSAENVAYNTTAQGAWNDWLASDAHRQNIEAGPDGGEYGLGSATVDGYTWFVQDFGFYA